MNRKALVVGINTYRYKGLNNLKSPAQDAEAVAQLLEKYGDFKVTRLPLIKDKDNDTVKVDDKTEVTLTEFEDAIAQLFTSEKQPTDTVLLYFSGHGLRKTKGGVQEGFLATSDVNSDVGFYGLSLQWLRRILQESQVNEQIIILDCCYSGELLNFAEADPRDTSKKKARCFLTACHDFEVSFEEIDQQHSVFTTTLLKGLEPPQSDKWVSNYTLVHLLNQQVNSLPQRPVFWSSGKPINLTKRKIKQSIKVSRTSRLGICPYKGLRYFDYIKEDAEYFYGRTALTDELLEKVRSGNFLAVLGASGSGKSSVVRAGLLYQLKLGERLSGSENWLIKIFKPGKHPLQSLELAFLDSGFSDIEREKLIAQGADGLRELVTSLIIDDTQKLVLVVDQFEETFALCKDKEERQKFFECLLGTVEQCGDKLCVVLTMRADFFGKCAEQDYAGLAHQIQQNLVTVTPMTPEELKQAIVEPAKQVELEIEPELVEEMLVDVANAPGILPLLQDTLTELWKNRSNNGLRLNTYAHLGGVMGTLRQRATKVYESFNQEEKDVCKHIFLALTQLGEGTEDTRRRCFKQDLVNKRYSKKLVDKVVQRLADEKLVVTSEIVAKGGISERFVIIDVAHEALIRYWTVLRQWLEENRSKLRVIRQVEQDLKLWQQTGEKDELLRGLQLAEAEDIYLKYYDELSDDVQKFIEASLAERKRKEEEEKRRLRIAQGAAIAFSVLSIAACAFGGLAYRERGRAKLEEIKALNSSSKGYFSSNQQLESLIASVKAGRELQKVISPPEKIKDETVKQLQKVVSKIQERNRLQGDDARIFDVKFSPNGEIIASASANTKIKLWRKDGSLIRTLTGHKNPVYNIYFTSDNEKIVSASLNGTIKIWKVSDDKPLKTLDNPTSGVISISPNSEIIASASDNYIKLLRMSDDSLLHPLNGDNKLVLSVSFSSDSETIVSAHIDKSIKLWNVSDGKLLETIDKQKHGINHVAFSPDGKIIAAASNDNTVKLWNISDVNNVQLIKELNGHEGPVSDVTFSPNGKFIASASVDKTIKLWNSDGMELDTFKGHKDTVTRVSFSKDNQTIASASYDNTIRIWQSQKYQTTSLVDTKKVKNLEINYLIINGCKWLDDYLKNNSKINSEDKKICDNLRY